MHASNFRPVKRVASVVERVTGERFDAAAAIYRRIGAGEPWIERVERLRAGGMGVV